MKNINVLVVIPARGGSKGIPRKNLRSLAGKPLIHYSIANAKQSRFSPDVYVTSEDEEILSISEKLGAMVIRRNPEDAQDNVTLDPVIYHAYQAVSENKSKSYDLVVTLQPTSPLLKTSSLDQAIEKIITNDDIDTVISAMGDTHLTWGLVDGKYKPNYIKRVNRQLLTPVFKETGGFLITRASNITRHSRIGERVDLHILEEHEAVDIDTFADWGLCEFYLKRKRILFVVGGNKTIGLGHVYNTLLIANDILDHDIVFLVDSESQMAYDKIASSNYKVFIQREKSIIDDIVRLSPDIVVNDRLDTTDDYVLSLKNAGYLVINFEDLGSGASKSDLTINAIYPEGEVLPNHYFGHKYFVIRDEFLMTAPVQIKSKVNEVLLSFGGVDPNNLTYKVLDSIYDECLSIGINIKVVLGFGYQQQESLKKFKQITVCSDVNNISDLMINSDIIFTSAGRTAYEIAAVGVPAIVLAQNERELTHLFANAENGFVNLGLGASLSNDRIREVFIRLVESFDRRLYMSELMLGCDMTSGRKRVVNLIKQVIES